MYIGAIFALTAECLRGDKVERQIAVLNFWGEIAQFEAEREAARTFAAERNGPVQCGSVGLIAKVADSLCPVVVGFMQIPEGEFDLESMDFSSAAMGASDCFSDVYAAAPAEVGPGVLAIWRSPGNRESKITALMCALAVAAAGTRVRRWSCDIFCEIGGAVLESCESKDDTVACFSLELLAQILSEFRIGLAALDDGRVIAAVESTVGRSPAVVRAGCRCLTAVCTLSPPDHEGSPLARWFDRVMHFIRGLLISPPLVASAFSAAAFVATFMPPSRLPACEFLVALAEHIMTVSNSSKIEYHVMFSIEGSICELCNAIALRLKNGLGELAPRLMRILLARRHTAAFEEALLAIDSVLLGIGSEFSPFTPNVMAVIWEMLHTGNQGCIATSLMVLADLFKAVPVLMERYAKDSFALLVPMIFDQSFGQEFGVDVTRALAEICAAVPHAVPVEHRDSLMSVMARFMRDARFDGQTREGFNRACHFFEAMLNGYRASIESARGDTAFLEANQDAFFAVVDAFVALRPTSTRTLIAFFQLLKAIATEVPGRNVRMRLNKRSIRALLDECAQRTDWEVATPAASLKTFLRTYKPSGDLSGQIRS
jgi:hypothetical protein